MEEKLLKKTEELIEKIMNDGIQTTNLDHLYKLVDIHKDLKEEESMRYNDYNNYNGYNNYGNNYGNEYGRRGYDTKYRGQSYMDRMYNEYNNYADSRERYGASQETDKAFQYMNKSLEEFIKFLFEEAQTPQEKNMLRETLQKSMM